MNRRIQASSGHETYAVVADFATLLLQAIERALNSFQPPGVIQLAI
jgi:hypothetical protein